MSNSLGNKLKITIFGQSHADAIGVVIDGFPAGFCPDMEQIAAFMQRRAPGRNRFSTTRKEDDIPNIVSGIVDGVTCGAPICAEIANTNQRSKDYSGLMRTPRPSHADFTAIQKFGGAYDVRGGGQFSGRLTAPLCFAGALCKQFLSDRGVYVGAQILEIAGIRDVSLDPVRVTREQLNAVAGKNFPVNDDEKGLLMQDAIEAARMELDSVGGIIRCFAVGVPAGLGDPMFGGVENRLAAAVFGVPAVRGVSFGLGFNAARLRGFEHNDPFVTDGINVTTETNNHGGILGGITSGMPIVMNVAIKPTASISREQRTVDLETMENTTLTIKGRHDPCIVPRAVPCIEAAAAVTLMDLML